MLPQALPLSACAGPAAHLPKRSMRLPVGKPPPPHNPVTTPRTIPPELTTRRGELTKRYTNQIQTSTSHRQWNANKYTSLSHQEPPCKYSSNGIPEQSSTVVTAAGCQGRGRVSGAGLLTVFGGPTGGGRPVWRPHPPTWGAALRAPSSWGESSSGGGGPRGGAEGARGGPLPAFRGS